MPFGYASHVPGGLQFGNCGSGFFYLIFYLFQGVETPSREISYSRGSADSFQLDRVRELNQRRLRVLEDMSERDRSGERVNKKLLNAKLIL